MLCLVTTTDIGLTFWLCPASLCNTEIDALSQTFSSPDIFQFSSFPFRNDAAFTSLIIKSVVKELYSSMDDNFGGLKFSKRKKPKEGPS